MRAVSLVLLMFSGLVQAQEEPRAMLRTRLETPGPVMVGEPIMLRVDVLVTTWLTRAPLFPAFEMEGALVVLPDERPLNLSERIDGQGWFGVSRSYLIYAQEPREYEIPAVEITVFYGQAEDPAALQSQPQSFRARIPAEAQGLGYFIATKELQVTQELDRGLDGLKVGDSIRRTIRMSADQTFAMFLPPVEFEEMDGLGLYPDPPQILDRTADRLGFQGGERVESATYVIRQEGEFELAPFAVYWWDLEAGRMREAAVPAVAFSAVPNPDMSPEIPLPEQEEGEATAPVRQSWLDLAKQWAGPLALSVLIVILAISVVPRVIERIGQRIAERRKAYQESEAAAFDQVRRAAQRGDGEGLVRYLYQWIDRILPGDRIGTVGSLAGKDRQLDKHVAALFANRYSNETKHPYSTPDFIKTLSRLRRGLIKSKSPLNTSASHLPPLNLTGSDPDKLNYIFNKRETPPS